MKQTSFSVLLIGCLMAFQFCTKESQSNQFSDAEIASEETSNPAVSDRTEDCGCQLRVVANVAGSLSTIPWLFEMVYTKPDGTQGVAQVYSNGTTWTPLQIKEGTTQQWEFIGGGNTSTVNVTATLSCPNDPCKICGKSKSYTVPANTPPYAYYDFSTSTNHNCDVE